MTMSVSTVAFSTWSIARWENALARDASAGVAVRADTTSGLFSVIKNADAPIKAMKMIGT